MLPLLFILLAILMGNLDWYETEFVELKGFYLNRGDKKTFFENKTRIGPSRMSLLKKPLTFPFSTTFLHQDVRKLYIINYYLNLQETLQENWQIHIAYAGYALFPKFF